MGTRSGDQAFDRRNDVQSIGRQHLLGIGGQVIPGQDSTRRPGTVHGQPFVAVVIIDRKARGIGQRHAGDRFIGRVYRLMRFARTGDQQQGQGNHLQPPQSRHGQRTQPMHSVQVSQPGLDAERIPTGHMRNRYESVWSRQTTGNKKRLSVKAAYVVKHPDLTRWFPEPGLLHPGH